MEDVLIKLRELNLRVYHTTINVGWLWDHPGDDYPQSSSEGITEAFFIAEVDLNFVFAKVIATDPKSKYCEVSYKPRSATEVENTFDPNGVGFSTVFINGLWELGYVEADATEVPF